MPNEVEYFGPVLSNYSHSVGGSDFFFLWLDSPIWAWASSFRRGFMITHIGDTSQSVGLLWTRDQLIAETST
jgi:hypothetical protein